MSDKTETIDGGTLVRAPKTCECKTPDIAKNKIEEKDEWTCGACKQLWRAKAAKVKEGEQGYGIWKRVSKRTRKSKTVPSTTEAPEKTPAKPK